MRINWKDGKIMIWGFMGLEVIMENGEVITSYMGHRYIVDTTLFIQKYDVDPYDYLPISTG